MGGGRACCIAAYAPSARERVDDPRGQPGRGPGASVEHDLGGGTLVRRIDAGEVADRACPRLRVEALDVALPGDVKRRVDEDLDELAFVEQFARHAPLARACCRP